MEKGGLAARLKAAKRAANPQLATPSSASAPEARGAVARGAPTPSAVETPAFGTAPSAPSGPDAPPLAHTACDALPAGPAIPPCPDGLTSPAVPAGPVPPNPPESADAESALDQAPALRAVASLALLDVWFWDEMRLGLHGQVRRVWAPIGEKVEQRLQIEYKWIYLVLAVNPVRGEVRTQWVANLKGPTLAPVLVEWFGAEPNAIVVWDGAPGHRNHAVQATGVRTVLLPPYSPELDPAERVFRALRPEVEGEVYANLAAKQALADDWLRTFAADSERVRAMIAWPWLLEQIRLAQEVPA